MISIFTSIIIIIFIIIIFIIIIIIIISTIIIIVLIIINHFKQRKESIGYMGTTLAYTQARQRSKRVTRTTKPSQTAIVLQAPNKQWLPIAKQYHPHCSVKKKFPFTFPSYHEDDLSDEQVLCNMLNWPQQMSFDHAQ